MSKGPKINYKKISFTTRDNLGLEGAATSMQADLCPIITTVTPRAFYWPFMVWNYYDYLQYSNVPKYDSRVFNEDYIKKNDYFFVLSNIINDNPDQDNLVGKTRAIDNYHTDKNGPYPYDRGYFISAYGGMQYYNGGCQTMGFITERDSQNNTFDFPRITEEFGKPMALAFERVIKDTRYYKQYRFSSEPVPKDVLKEFGELVTLDMKEFHECQELLKEALFNPVHNKALDNTNLIASKDYLTFLVEKYNISTPGTKEFRRILFDWFSPRGEYQYSYSTELESIVKGWECVIGRHYFVVAIEVLWKLLINVLNYPMSITEWVNEAMNLSNWADIHLDKSVQNYIGDSNFSFDDREAMIAKVYRGSLENLKTAAEISLKILLSIYNRFSQRGDIEKYFLEYGGDVSIAEFVKLVDEYKDKSVKDLLGFIMKQWIIERHQVVALNKMMQNRDGFYFEYNDGLYSPRVHKPFPDFPGIRMNQLLNVMKDLNMIK